MANDLQLATKNFRNVFIPFRTENSLGESSVGLTPISGYTLSNTPFIFTPILSAFDSTYIGASMDKIIWDFGDGTHSSGFQVEKQYKYPGEYEVRTIFTDQYGNTHKNHVTQSIKVYNYVPDALVWYTDSIADLCGGLPEKCLCGVPSEDLTILRYNSWQAWPMVSGDGGHFINLYSQGSISNPATPEQYWSSSDIHYVPTWRFIKDKTSRAPLDRVQTDNNEDIYVNIQNGQLTRCLETSPGSVYAGTSGFTTVNYLDDSPNKITSSRQSSKTGDMLREFVNENTGQTGQEQGDIILYASFDTSSFPVTILDDSLGKYELLKNTYFQMYETQKVGLPITVKFNCPRQLSITSNGVPDFPIHENKYNNSPMSYSIRTAGPSGNIVCTPVVVPLSSRWTAPSIAFSGGDITTDVLTAQGYVTMYLSGADSTFTVAQSTISSEEDFKVWDPGTVIADPANSFIRVALAPYTGLPSPSPTGRVVTLLLSQLTKESKEYLRGTARYTYTHGTGQPYLWETIGNKQYYGYVTPDSRYYHTDSVDMTVKDSYMLTSPNEGKIKAEASGSYTGFVNLDTDWASMSANNTYRFFAQTLIEPPLYFNYDVLYYYLANPSNDTLTQIKPVYYRKYSYGDAGFTQTYTSPVTTQTPGNSGMYGFAVGPYGTAIAVDGDTDRVFKYCRNLKNRYEIDIHTLLPDVSANHYPGNLDAYGYSPASVSLDKNLDYWITLYDTVSTIKVDGDTNKVVAVAVPPEANFLVDVRNTSPSAYWVESPEYAVNPVTGRPGEYGEQIISPTVVETCKNNDIVVTYTNPLCSFIARYSPTGEFLYKFDFPGEDRYFTGDVCIDVSDHIWAVTDTTGLLSGGQIDFDPPRSILYALDEELTLRFCVSSLSGTDYLDLISPNIYPSEVYDLNMRFSEYWDANRMEFLSDGFIIDEISDQRNPIVHVLEGCTYNFKNLYHAPGESEVCFREILAADSNIPLSADTLDFATTGPLLTDNVSGYGDHTISFYVSSTAPSAILLTDKYNSANTVVLQIHKNQEKITRPAETFDSINGMSHVIPDNNNNIWFSWGSRFISRYNVSKDTVDSTVAMGSGYYDPRYHPLSADMHDRRDYADRRSTIEGLSVDTGNNVLVINNLEKKVYAINSDVPLVSAHINVPNYQIPYEDFNWVTSIGNTATALSGDFLYPSSLSEEQVKVFLENAPTRNLTIEENLSAANNYVRYVEGNLGNGHFRTAHGNNPVSATGFEQEIRAGGDWTGWRWINKFDDRVVASDESSGTVSITGASAEFKLWPRTGTHSVVKVNEDVDFAGVLREYMRQPALKDKQMIYNEYTNAIFGTVGSSPGAMGKRVYEKISNFLSNHSDIDVCTIAALEDMAAMVNHTLDNSSTPLPSDLSRLMDIVSIKFSKLRGALIASQEDFDKHGNWESQTLGKNLGAELMFIFEYDSEKTYLPGDFVRYNGEYYQAVTECTEGVSPVHVTDSVNWIYWPDGLVKARHMSVVKKIYPNKTTEWQQDYYDGQVTIIKLIEDLRVEVGKPFVLHEEHTDTFFRADPLAITWNDHREFKVTVDTNGYQITDPNSRFGGESMVDISYRNEIMDISNGNVLVTTRKSTHNPTVILFKNRTYKLKINSPGHPVIITTSAGPSAHRLLTHISNQEVEFGEIVIKTGYDPVHGHLPEVLYYQSVNDHTIGGVIETKDVSGLENYSTAAAGLTAYNLNISVSSHDDVELLGWGLTFPDGANAWQYYSIYEYIPYGNDEVHHIDNVIDWDSPMTTVSFATTSYDDWSRLGGIADVMIEKSLREGLDYFDGLDIVEPKKAPSQLNTETGTNIVVGEDI